MLSTAALWHIDETSGSSTADASGNSNTGTLSGSAAFTTGRTGASGALSVPSAGEVDVADSSSLDITSQISLSAWVNATSWNTTAHILEKSTSGTDNQYLLAVSSGNLIFTLSGVGSVTAALPSTGAWHFVAATYNGSVMKLYVDGSLAGSSSHSGSINTSAGSLVIGNKPGSSASADHFNGKIDDVEVDNAALTQSQVEGLAGFPSGWSDADIGSPSISGGAAFDGDNWTVAGAGTDINGTSDQFNFASQTLSGDGSITAQVLSQSYTGYFAKTGLMIRNDSTAGSAYAAVFLEPGYGASLDFQWRATAGGSTSNTTISGVTAPVWLKLTQWNGSYFNAYYSTNGTTWTQIGSTQRATVGSSALGGLAVGSYNSSSLGVATFGSVAVTTTTAPTLPSGWSDSDVGSPTIAGAAGASGGTWTVLGAGTDIGGTSDQFNFASQTLSGDGSITAQVLSQSYTGYFAKTGLMIRNDSTAGSAYAAVFLEPGYGASLDFQWRATAGGSTSNTTISGVTAPVWLKLTQWNGSYFNAYYSTNGTTWTQIGSTQRATVGSSALGGLAVGSYNSSTLGAATFGSVAVTTTTAPTLPSGWSDSDVGSPTISGAAGASGGAWTVLGAGSDIGGTSDQFNFASQSLSGDGSITAQVLSQSNTAYFAKAGLMIRNNSTAGSAYAAVFLEPGSGASLDFQWRATAGGSTSNATVSGITAPVWLKLTRWSGNYFNAYYSTNGTTWTQIGSTQTAAVGSGAACGLAVTSYSSGTLGLATFGSVAVTTASAPTLPSGWSDGDIGSPAIAGAGGVNSSTWTVVGCGSDINGTSDQFNFASESFSGDGSIAGQVLSQSNTGYFAKAGLMMRNDSSAGSAYAAVFVEPGVGVDFQWRSTASGSTTNATVSGQNAPVWLMLNRIGNSLAAYYSSDGATWHQVGATQTVSIAGTALAGLAVSSYAAAQLGSATFNNVSVTTPVLPAGWTAADIGSPAAPSTVGYDGQTLTVTSRGALAGADPSAFQYVGAASDSFNAVYQALGANQQIVTQVTGQQNGDALSKSGIALRASTAGNSTFVGLYATPGWGVIMLNRAASGANAGEVAYNPTYSLSNGPLWLKLTDVSGVITGYASTDNSTWSQIGQVTASLGSTPIAGVASSGTDAGFPFTSSFANFALGSVTSMSLAPQTPYYLMAESYSGTDGRVDWKPLPGVSTYTIQQSTDGGVTFNTVAAIPGTADTYLPNNLTPSTTYTYRIRATDSSSVNSGWSPTVSMTTGAKATSGYYGVATGTPHNIGSIYTDTMSVSVSATPTFAASWEQAYFLTASGSASNLTLGNNYTIGNFTLASSGNGYYGQSFGFLIDKDTGNLLNDTDGHIGANPNQNNDFRQDTYPKAEMHSGVTPPAGGGDPIGYADGATQRADYDLASTGFTGAWSVTRNWTARSQFTQDDTFGNGWMNQPQTHLMNLENSSSAPSILLATSAYTGTEFDFNSLTSTYVPTAVSNDTLTHNSTTHTYTWLDRATGAQSSYYDFTSSNAANLQGKLKSYADADGNQIGLTYTSGQLTTVTETDSAGDNAAPMPGRSPRSRNPCSAPAQARPPFSAGRPTVTTRGATAVMTPTAISAI